MFEFFLIRYNFGSYPFKIIMKNSNLKKLTFPLIIASSAGILISIMSKKGSPYQKLAVQDLEVESYLGKWYEIARFDFKHEKDLKNVTAEYSLRKDGKIKVLNKGYDFVKNEWKEAVGKAKFVKEPNVGTLKVSFFGPFYAEYNIVLLEPDYSSVLILGESHKYMWILSRGKTLSDAAKNKYVEYAKQHGFPVENLVWTVH